MRQFKWYSFLLFAALIIVGCKNEMADIKAATDTIVVPLQTNLNAEYRYTERGKLQNILKAKKIEQYGGEEPYIHATSGFEIIFYDTLAKENAWLSADEGLYYEQKNKLIANGNVVLRNIEGEKLETSELIFEQDSSRIYTDKNVKITSGSGIFYGRGLESNDSFTKYRILKPTGDIFLDEESNSPLSSSNGEGK